MDEAVVWAPSPEGLLGLDEVCATSNAANRLRGGFLAAKYQYDAARRLSDVLVDGSVARHYDYDPNGNRIAVSTGNGVESCSCDAQDRLTSCGGVSYSHNVVGQRTAQTVLATGASTLFDYDVFGNLRTVTLPDGRSVQYEIDAKNRRIGRRCPARLTRWFGERTRLGLSVVERVQRAGVA